MSIDSGDAFLPADDFLLVTRLPNFLSPDFENLLQLDPSQWPQILVFQGIHGIGTRAAELLLGASGLHALHSINTGRDKTPAFQALFRVTDVDLTGGGFHKFHKIEAVEVVSLDIDTNHYQLARAKALEILHQWSSATSP